jgi:uncharacterized protein (TIGR03086 family)
MEQTMTNPSDPISALARSYDDLAAVVSTMSPDQWASPTDCPAWDAKDLVNHILGGGLMYVAANDGVLTGEDHGDLIGDDPKAAIESVAANNLASWRKPGALEGERTYPWGTFPAPVGLLINLGEVLVHTWDLADATGQPATIDSEAATLVFDLYANIPMDGMRAGGVYGPELSVPESAPVTDRLLGLLSRQA